VYDSHVIIIIIVSYVGYRFITACSLMRFSVVFGVSLRLLVINISSSSPAINTASYYQRCVITCDTLAVLHRRPRLQHLPVAALTQAVKPDIGSESRFLPTPPAFDAPVRGVLVWVYCHPVWCGKTRMVWLPEGEKNWRYLYSFSHNARTWQTHTQRNRHTAWRHRPRLNAKMEYTVSPKRKPLDVW